MIGSVPTYLSAQSANALISDLRPTTLSPPALSHLNLLLDELLISLITASQSINPYHLRREGVPSVFSGDKGATAAGESTGLRALGRSAVAEAEVELRSWYEGRSGIGGFPPGGQGTGTRNERTFPINQAVDLLRLKCVSFSTLAPQDPPDQSVEDEIISAWKTAGGDASDDTIEPAGLWITAILEHVCEHILSQLSRVVARDSGITVAGTQDLYTALCEDESVWGFFKRMKVKEMLEGDIRSGNRSKRSTPAHSSPGGRASPASVSYSPHESKISLVSSRTTSGAHPREGSLDASRGISSSSSANDLRSSAETSRFTGIARKGSTLSRKSVKNNALSHERSGSVLSDNTRSMLGAFNDSIDNEGQERSQSPQDAQDEFDRLVRSGETMRVSLTPSRLKNFETASAGRRKPTESPSQRASPSTRALARDNGTPALPSNPRLVSDSPVTTESTDTEIRSPPSARSSPSVNGRARLDSGQRRLLARGATTIEENAEEEDDQHSGLSGPAKPKKESLMELLASEDTFGPLGKISGRKPINALPEKRTVPAVVLGTPPPPAAAQVRDPPQLSSPPPLGERTTRQDSIDSGDTSTRRGSAARSRRRTEAQELADFFNSTAPPAPPAEKQEDEPPLTAKSAKSFRSLVAKMTGGSKKSKDDEKLPASSSHTRLTSLASENGFPDPTLQQAARRQKSMHSMSSTPSAFKHYGLGADDLPATKPRKGSAHFDDPPIPPQKTVSRKNSADQSQAVALPGDIAPVSAVSSSKQTEDTLRKGRVPVPSLENAAPRQISRRNSPEKVGMTNVTTASTPFRKPSPTKHDERPDRPVDNVDANLPAPPAVNRSVQQDGKSSLGPVIDTLPLPPSRPPITVPSPSDATSFQTADEGDEDSKEGVITNLGTGSSADEEGQAMGSVTSTNLPHPAVSQTSTTLPTASSIPLSDLIPLRSLLDHATTARECRLLLSAILTQYGVPLSPESSQTLNEPLTPEDRVTAWLLAGRDGPVGDVSTHQTSIAPETNHLDATSEHINGKVGSYDVIAPAEGLSQFSSGQPTAVKLGEAFMTTETGHSVSSRPTSSSTSASWSNEEEELLTESEGIETIEEAGVNHEGEGRTTPKPSKSGERVSVVHAHKGERSSPRRYIAGEEV